MTTRREFVTLLGGMAAAWPVVARAQQTMPVVGFLNNGTPKANDYLRAAFLRGVSETGYIEGRNVTIEYHWAEDHDDRLPVLAADLVGRRVNVIAATSTQAALAAQAATATVPIVFETGGDPIKLGLVASLNRPGGNITGVTQLSSELVAKRLGLLHDLIPTATIIGFLVTPTDPITATQTRDMQEAAHALGLQIHVLNASTEREIDTAFAMLPQIRADALLVGAGENATAGGLISYGTSITDSYRQAGIYTGRVLKGEKPADLPVLQATKFEFVINQKTAKTLGLTIPSGVLAITDEVIE
jgi:putative ABC transport system substrate-binding protein